MIVHISHPVWLHAIPPGRQHFDLVATPCRTAVNIPEVGSGDVAPAFIIAMDGQPAISLLSRTAMPSETGVWWPVQDAAGRGIPVDEWVEAIGRDDNAVKAESGFGFLLDRKNGWPRDARVPRRIMEDFREEQRAAVGRIAANDLMIYEGLVWRRKADPVYRIKAGDAPTIEICPLREPAETRIGFDAHRLDKMIYRRPPPGEARYDDPNDPDLPSYGYYSFCFYNPDHPDVHVNNWMADDDVAMAGGHFRADDRDQALEYAARCGLPLPSIEVIQPAKVTALPSLLHVKATYQRYAAVLRNGRSYQFKGIETDSNLQHCQKWLDDATLTWDINARAYRAAVEMFLDLTSTVNSTVAKKTRAAVNQAIAGLDRDIGLNRDTPGIEIDHDQTQHSPADVLELPPIFGP